MDKIKINLINKSEAEQKILNNIYALSKLSALDDDNLQVVDIDGIRYSGVYIKHNQLNCIQCHNPIPKLKEKMHIHMDNATDKSIYQCDCGQYIIKTYSC